MKTRHPAPARHATILLLASVIPGAGAGRTDAQEAPAARARAAQRDFEAVRRRHYDRDFMTYDRCDEHVGRFCLNHDGDDGWTPPPEDPEVTEGRRRLLAALATAAAHDPSDQWVLGQRAKYLLEDGRAGEALEALRRDDSCADARWWCAALRGFVLHREGRSREAEAAFDAARAAMAGEQRCAWDDIAPLLEPDDRATYEDLPCGSPGRGAFEERFWHLSDPWWSVPGGERRAEHYTRRVWAAIQTDAASGYGLSWGRDLEELTVRYGWPAGWDVAWRRIPGVRTERSVEAHRASSPQRFVASDIPGDPAWSLDDEEPLATWSLPGGPIESRPDYQLAAFRRGGRRVFVGALAAPDSTPCTRETSLILSGPADIVALERARAGAALAREPEPGGVQLIGLESRCTEGGGGARVRLGAPRPANWLSDLLLLDPADTLPGTLDATLAHVRPHARVRPGENLVVFWEWYGPADPMTVTLTLSRESRSFWRKALEWTGLADRGIERTGVRWSEAGEGGERPRAVRLELPDLAEGGYRLTLQVQSARIGSVSSTRDIVVER